MSDYPKIHLSFPVRDLERSVAFYRKFFGEEPVKVHPGYVKFLPSIAPLNLALFTDGTAKGDRTAGDAAAGDAARGDAAKGDAANHFGIEVRDHESVLRHLLRIRGSGLEIREEMDCDCCYANQDKFWVEDPDGREWEIYVLNRDLDLPAGAGGSDGPGGPEEAACCADLEPGGQAASGGQAEAACCADLASDGQADGADVAGEAEEACCADLEPGEQVASGGPSGQANRSGT